MSGLYTRYAGKMGLSALGSALAATVATTTVGPAWADDDLPSTFSNRGTIANTRHNLTQRQQESGSTLNAAVMDPYRNNYGEVCVYCHTPHGANTNVVPLPLWNRTIRSTTYTTYDALGTSTLTQPVSQPGAASLSCLSCHDGQTAVDSIINMPTLASQTALLASYPGGYLATQDTTPNNAFLNAWNGAALPGSFDAFTHMSLSSTGCLSCHSRGPEEIKQGATDFTVFAIGTDLRNDHPVGVRFPAANLNLDFKQPNQQRPSVKWFDDNSNNRPDKNEVRFYASGDGSTFAVECASCHDPHGVPTGGAGTTFIPTFLRVSNANSALCLTCHVK